VSDALERVRRWDAVVGVDDAVARAVAEERAAVVAWLREHGSGAWLEHGGLSLVSLDGLADTIERGEHRREEEP